MIDYQGKTRKGCSVGAFKDICPSRSLLNFKFLMKIYILDRIMFYSKVLLSTKFIICDSQWKMESLRKYIKAREKRTETSTKNKTLIRPPIKVNLNKVIS